MPLANITAIRDVVDDPGTGLVDWSGYLGESNRQANALADKSGGNRHVVLAWPAEPNGLLTVLRGSAPTALSSIGSTATGGYVDAGALDDPSDVLYYRVTGPCP